MRTTAEIGVLVLAVMVNSGQVVGSQLTNEKQSAAGQCDKAESIECRAWIEGVVQGNLRSTFPHIRADAVGDVLFLADSDAPERDVMQSQSRDTLVAGVRLNLCRLGFRELQLQSSGATPSVILELNCPVGGNPRSKDFDAPSRLLFGAALRAAAGHRIIRAEDEGLKPLDEKGQEILSFSFPTTIRGYTHGVLADVEVASIGSDSAKLTIFYHKQGGTNVWVPSASFQLRKAQLEARLQQIIDGLDRQRYAVESRYESGGISLHEKLQADAKIENQEYAAKMDKIRQERDARVADLAQMPTSTFPAMVEASDAFFNLVDRNLRALTPSK
jgi:hypothetical protein